MNMSFEEFTKHEHKKRVAHLVQFCHTTGRPPSIANVSKIFGIKDSDCAPIIADAIVEISGKLVNSETVTSYEIRWKGTLYSNASEVPITPISYANYYNALADYQDMLRLIPKDELGNHTLTYEQVDRLSHTVEEISYDGIVESVGLYVVATTRTEHKLK